MAPQKSDKVTPIPESFPPETRFVCVSDNDQTASGFDGGPEVGGSGAWPKGAVRRWTASHAVPLALRSPEDGTIVRGYVEPVESEAFNAQGKPVVTSTKYFAVREKDGTWKAVAPSARALQRANIGAASITKALQPVRSPAVQRAMDAGLATAQ